MNSSYKHLTLSERESIMLMHSQGKTQTEIAQALGRSVSTISRELKRHSLAEYRASLAYSSYQAHRKRCKVIPKLQQVPYRRLVQEKILQEGWSPEQLSARLKLEKSDFSHVGRAPSAQNRSRFGHWEADTMLGKSGGACLVTLTDRKSRFELAKKIARKKAELVQEAMIGLLQSHKLRSITPYRGKEFAKHHLVTQALGVEFYFPEPHQPWQRGTNENTNGLLREYFPKQQDMNQWNDDDIQRVIDKLNQSPRKCLGWKTPCEVYFGKSLHLV